MERRVASDRTPQLSHGYCRRPKSWEVEPIPPAHAHPGFWLRAAEWRVSGTFANKLKEWHLIPSEWEVLRLLYRSNPPSIVELAHILRMTKGGVSKLINRLVIKALVVKTVSPFDRRYRTLSLGWTVDETIPRLSRIEAECDRRSFRALESSARPVFIAEAKRLALSPRRPTPPTQRPKARPAHPLPVRGTFREREFGPAQVIPDAYAGYG